MELQVSCAGLLGQQQQAIIIANHDDSVANNTRDACDKLNCLEENLQFPLQLRKCSNLVTALGTLVLCSISSCTEVVT